MEEGRWRGWDNAEIYERFVRERRIYAWLNERLVERAAPERARRVLDLGCGTGATTRAFLRRLPAGGEIVGIDASREMVEVARAATLDPRARFVVGDAAAADRLVEGPFDRAVSNAAFWQLGDPREVLRALGALLAPGALLVFDVPAERVPGAAAPIHPFQVALARAIEARIGEPWVPTATPFDPAAFGEEAEAAGFAVASIERLEWEGPQGELIELMEIPAMIAPLARGLDAAQTEAALAEAKAASDPRERVRVPWLYFVVERRQAPRKRSIAAAQRAASPAQGT